METDNLIKQLVALIDARDYDRALNLIHQRLSLGLGTARQKDISLKANLAGFLIDIGAEGGIEVAASEGLAIYEREYSVLRKFIKESSLQYNLGNGKSALFRIQQGKPGFKFTPKSIESLTNAKNHYWKAYKLLEPNENKLRPQLLINLANALRDSGRIVEAFQYFDLTLAQFPDFPQAIYNRSQALLDLNNLSNTYTVTMLRQAMTGFDRAAGANGLPSWVRERGALSRDKLRSKLQHLGHSDNDDKHDLDLTKDEFNALSLYRKYCLLNHLALSEHSLYCKCNGARWDNLTIPMPHSSIEGSFIPRMEHVLNRLKAEYALARLLYYHSVYNPDMTWAAFDEEVAFTELYEGEIIGLRPEMNRVSFRLCFGILDKIAQAICELYDLAAHIPSCIIETYSVA